MRTTRGVRWSAGEEARVCVGLVTACARDEARLGWSPRGGGAAGSDRFGGEDEATEKKARRLQRGRRRRRQRGRELREKGMVYKGGPIVLGDG